MPLRRSGIIILLILTVSAAHGGEKVFRVGEADEDHPIRKIIQYDLTVRNTSPDALRGAEVWAYAPARETAGQRCLTLEASHPAELTSTSLGNQVLHFRFDVLPPFGTKAIQVRAVLAMTDGGAALGPSGDSALLGPEPLIESDHPEILLTAQKVRGPSTADTVRGAFRWTVENLSYSGYLAEDRGALYALRNRTGDCTEYACLMAALCRAAGVPARALSGYVYPSDAVVRPSDFHSWVEAADGSSWVTADPQKNRFAQGQSDYVAFTVMGSDGGNPLAGSHRFKASDDKIEISMR